MKPFRSIGRKTALKCKLPDCDPPYENTPCEKKKRERNVFTGFQCVKEKNYRNPLKILKAGFNREWELMWVPLRLACTYHGLSDFHALSKSLNLPKFSIASTRVHKLIWTPTHMRLHWLLRTLQDFESPQIFIRINNEFKLLCCHRLSCTLFNFTMKSCVLPPSLNSPFFCKPSPKIALHVMMLIFLGRSGKEPRSSLMIVKRA